jgi:hypothetical protein
VCLASENREEAEECGFCVVAEISSKVGIYAIGRAEDMTSHCDSQDCIRFRFSSLPALQYSQLAL